MRQDNIAMLMNTLTVLHQGWYEKNGMRKALKLTQDQMEEAVVFLPDDVRAISGRKDPGETRSAGGCGYGCENEDSFTLARKRMQEYASDLQKEGAMPVLVLNLANPVNPGGGVRKGAKAQEEDLCRKSSLLLSLEGPKALPYYEYNRSLNTFMGSDAVIIHPQVEIIKDENGDLLDESKIVAVMTCAAPMLDYGKEGMTEEQYEDMLLQRIDGMLKVAAHLGYRYLVLGAFGCGAFGNDARIVSDLFRKALEEFNLDGMKEKDAFQRIDFAVLDRSRSQYNFREFSRNFARSGVKKDRGETAGQEQPAPVLFWKDDEPNGCFSNWYRAKFTVDDFEYFCVEQYMMARKAKFFHDQVRYTAILRADSARECKDLGRQVTPFDANAWNEVKYGIVKAGSRAKYEQNPALKAALLRTGSAVLAEASPIDRIWGIGLDAAAAKRTEPSAWPGLNLLGRILMELREEFAGQKSEKPGTVVRLILGDITKVSDVGAIVNAANGSPLGGGGVDGAIHRAAGPKLLEACRKLNGCETGEAKITGAYDLPCGYVIHTVGPVWRGGKFREEELLAGCYKNSLQLAADYKIRRIAFPSISTGAYGYPAEDAAMTALRTAARFIEEHPGALDLVEWVLFDKVTYDAYEKALYAVVKEKKAE